SAFSGVVRLVGLVISVERVVVTLSAIVLIAALYLFLRWSRPGRAMRAVAQDPDAAALQGVNIDAASALGFGVGCALAGGAGGLLAPLFAVSPAMGALPVVKAFIIIIVGGMGSLPGAVLGGLLLGGVEGLGALFMGSAAVNILGFLMAIGALVAASLAVPIASIALRVSGPYYFLITFAFSEVVRLFFNNFFEGLFGGPSGLVGIPKPGRVLGLAFDSKLALYGLMAVM